MLNKSKKCVKVLIIIISLIFSILLEISFFQKDCIKAGNVNNEINVINYDNISIKNGKYITTDVPSSIIIDTNNDYINEFKFNYKSISDFEYKIITTDIDNNEQTKQYTSASIINISNKKIHKRVKQIELIFNDKDIEAYNFEENNKMHIDFSRIFCFFMISTLTLSILTYRNKINDNIDKMFLFISIILGSIIILITPISAFTSNDDQVHFHRVYTLFDSNKSKWNNSERYYDKLLLNAPSRFTTSEEYNEYYNFLNKNSTFVYKDNINNNLSYDKVVYIPQAIIMKICRMVNCPFTIMIYLTKLINLLIYSILIYFAIKITPICKKTFFIIGLLPTALYLSTQFSYDPPITGACLLATAFFLKMLSSKKINNKDYVMFVLLLVWACLPKAVYSPLFLLPIFIDKDRFNSKKDYNNIRIISIILFMLFMSTYLLPVLFGTVQGDSRVAGTSVSLQLKYILSYPFNYVKILAFYTVKNISNFLFGFDTYTSMGYIISNNNSLFNFLGFLILISVLYIIFTDVCDKEIITNKIKIIMFILLSIIWVLIATSLYMSWTPVGSQFISGVQGRYFIPLLPIVFILLKPVIKKEKIVNYENILPILIFVFTISIDIMYIFYMFHC